MRTVARLFAYAFLVIAATLGGAAAQTIGTLSAAEIEKALSDAGYSPKVIEDTGVQNQTTGDPFFSANMVLSGGSKIVFYVRSSGCTGKPAACEALILFANFDLDRDVAPDDFRAVNRFNDVQVTGRSYVLEADKQVGVDYTIDVGGGVTREHLVRRLAKWPDVVQTFIDTFTEKNSKQ